MARTHKSSGGKKWYKREDRAARVETSRRLRRDSHHFLRVTQDWEAAAAPKHQKTSGHLTH